jgi:type VI secretion system protein ImpF
MVKREIERTVQPSILDRLTDTEPRVSTDPRMSYPESLRLFKLSVQRDLEWLLNTRRTPRPAPDEFVELQNSLYNYGVPDITSLSSDSPDARMQLVHDVEQVLAMFEPRLANVHIEIVDAEGEARRRELRFVVEATLRLDPTPEQVMFDTVLYFSSGQIDVKDQSNA